MSKQSEARHNQGYSATAPTCIQCQRLKFDMVMPTWMVKCNKEDVERGRSPTYSDDNVIKKNLRCGIGGFAVKQRGSCNLIAV